MKNVEIDLVEAMLEKDKLPNWNVFIEFFYKMKLFWQVVLLQNIFSNMKIESEKIRYGRSLRQNFVDFKFTGFKNNLN